MPAALGTALSPAVAGALPSTPSPERVLTILCDASRACLLADGHGEGGGDVAVTVEVKRTGWTLNVSFKRPK